MAVLEADDAAAGELAMDRVGAIKAPTPTERVARRAMVSFMMADGVG